LDKKLCKLHRFPTLKYWSNKIEVVFLHSMLKKCDAVFPITQFMKSNLYRQYNIPCEKMFPFTMGINSKYIKQRKFSNIPGRTIKLVYVGTLIKERNLESLLKSYKLVSESDKSLRIQLSFVGGKSKDIERLKDVANKYNVSKKIKFYGQVKRTEVYKIIASHDIGISYIPSDIRFFDSSPTKLMEYIGIGIPVIATDCVLLQKKIVEDTNAGLLTSDDPEDIAQKIIKLIQNLKYYNERAILAYKYIIDHYDYEQMREKIHQIFNQISEKK